MYKWWPRFNKIMQNWRRGGVIIGIIFLSGCAAATFEGKICPPVPDYSIEFQEKIINSIEELPEDSPLILVFDDYLLLRDQIRACHFSD